MTAIQLVFGSDWIMSQSLQFDTETKWQVGLKIPTWGVPEAKAFIFLYSPDFRCPSQFGFLTTTTTKILAPTSKMARDSRKTRKPKLMAINNWLFNFWQIYKKSAPQFTIHPLNNTPLTKDKNYSFNFFYNSGKHRVFFSTFANNNTTTSVNMKWADFFFGF